MSSPYATHTIHIQNAPHRLYHSSPAGGPFIRNIHPNPYQVNYHPPYFPFHPHFDSSVNLNNAYIYDPNHVKHRRRTTPEQLKVLEDTFKTDPKPNPALRKQLSIQLGMSPRVLQVWFQNRRMKVKRLAKKHISASGSTTASADQDQDDNEFDQSAAEIDPQDTLQEQDREQDHEIDSVLYSPGPSPSVSEPDPGRRNSLSGSPNVPSDVSSAASSATTAAATAATSSPPPSSAVSAPIPTFDALPDTALFNNRRHSFASLHRLDSHPCISLLAASNSVLPLTRPMHHHYHSPSTPAPLRIVPPGPAMTMRSASFHALPTAPQYHTHNQQQAQNLQYPYAFPPRPIVAPIPGPLPAADYSFGTASMFSGNSNSNSAAPGTEYLGGTDYVESTGTDYSSRSGSVDFSYTRHGYNGIGLPRASVSSDYTGSDFTTASGEYSRGTSGDYSRTSGSVDYTRSGTNFGGSSLREWEEDTASEKWGGSRFAGIAGSTAGEQWDMQGRRGSCTGQVAEMFSTLEVGDKWENNTYQQQHQPTKEGHRHSLPHREELLYPCDASHVPLSKSSELAFALQPHGQRQDTIIMGSVNKDMGHGERNPSHNHSLNDGRVHEQQQSDMNCISIQDQTQHQHQHQADAQGNGQGQSLNLLHVPNGEELGPSTPTNENTRGVVNMDMHHGGCMNHEQTGALDNVLGIHHALADYMEESGVAGYAIY